LNHKYLMAARSAPLKISLTLQLLLTSSQRRSYGIFDKLFKKQQ